MTDIINFVFMLSSSEEDGTWVNKAGFFDDYMNIVAIVLILVGIGIIYFGVKLIRGYTFHPDETVVVEKDNDFAVVNSNVAERRQTEIPNYSASAAGKGKDVFRELRIVYSVEGGEYSQWISDSGGYGDTVPIKYNPDDPTDFYVIDGGEDFEGIPDENGELDGNEDKDVSDGSPSKGLGIFMTLIGILIGALGTGFLVDYLTR